MATVHVFICTGRFRSFEHMRAFIDQRYTPDGDGIPSPFMREVALAGYEPGCIEAMHAPAAVPLPELLADASWADQWLPLLDPALRADAAICVFAPNVPGNPQGSSLHYCGGFPYVPLLPPANDAASR